jgi:hypothetical protein
VPVERDRLGDREARRGDGSSGRAIAFTPSGIICCTSNGIAVFAEKRPTSPTRIGSPSLRAWPSRRRRSLVEEYSEGNNDDHRRGWPRHAAV